MKARFSFDGNAVAYLLHGQDFTLDIQAKSCWFILIKYNSGLGSNWSLHRPHTRFNSIANAYHPTIRIWGIGWGIKLLLQKSLNINTLSVIEQKVKVESGRPNIRTGKPLSVRIIQIYKALPLIKIPSTKFKTPSAVNTKTYHTITINT